MSPIESVTTALEVPGNVEGGNGAYPGAQSVSRALMLLKCFSDAQPEWNLGDLAQYTGLNKATVHRLLAALESEGFIVRSARTGGYRLGPTLIVLGGCAMRSNDLRTVSRRMLEALAQQTGESTTLEVLAGSEVVILDEVSSRHLLGMSQDVGARLPAHATATGKLLLAHLEPEALALALAAPLQRLAPRTVVSRVALREQLGPLRAAGVAITEDELEAGFVAVAAPVVDHAGDVVAAVSIGGPGSRLVGEALTHAVACTQAAAARISRELGAR